MISFDKVTKTFASGFLKEKKIVALDEICINFPPGKIIGVLGENGAGKTTIIKLISGLLLPTSGKIFINNKNWQCHKEYLLHAVGTMLEGGRSTHWPLSVRQNLQYFGVLRGIQRSDLAKRIESSIDFFGLRDKENTPVYSLSQGMKQKLALAIAMLPEPKYLLLDEPVSGIDVPTSLIIQDRLKELSCEKGMTILITTHDMHVAQRLCDRVIIIKKGNIIAEDDVGNLVELFSERRYNIKFHTSHINNTGAIKANSMLPESSWDDTSATLSFTLGNSDTIDNIVYRLAQQYGPIESIQSEKIKLEEIYTKLIHER